MYRFAPSFPLPSVSLTSPSFSASQLYNDGVESETTFTARKKVSSNKRECIAYRGKPYEKFVWNIHLLEKFKDQVHPDWILYIIHGFVGQSSILSF